MNKLFKMLLLVILTATFCIVLQFTYISSVRARPTPPVIVATNWRYGIFPVENFQAYTSPFGYRTSSFTGKQEFHNGLDIAGPLGSYIRSWWSGKVVSLSAGGNCGTMVKIESGKWTHTYCHLMGTVEQRGNGVYLIDNEGGIVLQEGMSVPAGQRIARIGMTGRTTGPHLHWILMYGGNYIDPAEVLRQMASYN